MNISQRIETLKKGCGKENENRFLCGKLFSPIISKRGELCLTCKALLKQAEEIKEEIESLKCYCEICAFEGNCDGTEKLVKLKEIIGTSEVKTATERVQELRKRVEKDKKLRKRLEKYGDEFDTSEENK